MFNIKKYSLFFGSFSLLLVFGFTYTVDQPCLKEVRAVFDKMNEPLTNGKISYLKYTLTATLNSDKQNEGVPKVNKATFEWITGKNQSRMYSKDMIVLKDAKNIFTILPEKKTIYSNNIHDPKKEKNNYQQLQQLQDTIFKYATKVECKEVQNKTYTKIVSVYLSTKIATTMEVEKAEYYFNHKTGALIKLVANYLPGKQLKSVVYDFNEINYDYKKENMQQPVKELIFTGNTLNKNYQGFKVISLDK